MKRLNMIFSNTLPLQLDQEKQKARHEKRLAKGRLKQRKEQLLLDNIEEEKTIKRLEKQLG